MEGGIERWLWVMVVMASLESVPTRAVQYYHNQLVAFIDAFRGRPPPPPLGGGGGEGERDGSSGNGKWEKVVVIKPVYCLLGEGW